MRKIIILLGILVLSTLVFANIRVRRVAVIGDQIVTVHTAMGIATIIQVPDRPNSVVVGDQDAFKVEYLDQAITIKPLSGRAKSNLYVYTDWKRYNVQLISGVESIADYVVYLENPKKDLKMAKGSSVIWTSFKNSLKNDNLKLEVNRLGRAKDGVLLIEFLVKGTSKAELKPESLWLTQNGATRPIQNLFLSAVKILPSNPASGVIQLQQDDFDSSIPIQLELRRKKSSFLTIQKVNLWK
jgi:hypothetical protein